MNPLTSQKHLEIQDYYGNVLQTNEDLKTNACCTEESMPAHIAEALMRVHPEVQAKYYGCGLTIPSELEGLRILDLGSGSGRDCYIAAQLVGPSGAVVGVDMTDDQLAVANEYLDYHQEKFGFPSQNVSFLKGNIESLDELDLEPGSFDLIISNCVINLATDKAKVLRDAFNLLKPGGEMYFSDVYCDRRVPADLQADPVLWGECLSGAMYWNDFLGAAMGAGFTDPRAVSSRPITVDNPELEQKLGSLRFFSVNYRLFKIEGLDRSCEDFGQAVAYKGGIEGLPHAFDLDDHHHFPKGKLIPVCGNTYQMLHDTRFQKHFDFYGTWDTHFGIFEGCGQAMPFQESDGSPVDAGGSCC